MGRSPGRSRSRPAADAPPGSGVSERILAAASDLFYREGVRAVGIQRVIDDAGIAKASLYAHYASKDELVAACLSRQGDALRAALEKSLRDPALDARSKLLRIFDLQTQRIASPGFRGCPFQNTGSEFTDAGHPAHVVTVTYRRWIRDLFTSLVREAGLRNPDALAGALIVLHDGAAAAAQMDGSPAAARHARWAAEQLLDSQPSRRRAKHR
jgi:AcrR family transcriptional regulator